VLQQERQVQSEARGLTSSSGLSLLHDQDPGALDDDVQPVGNRWSHGALPQRSRRWSSAQAAPSAGPWPAVASCRHSTCSHQTTRYKQESTGQRKQ